MGRRSGCYAAHWVRFFSLWCFDRASNVTDVPTRMWLATVRLQVESW